MLCSKVNRTVVCSIGAIFWTFVPWTFHDIAWLAFGLIAFTFLAITSSSRASRIILSGVAAVCGVGLMSQRAELDPLQSRVSGASFSSVRLAVVLQHVARQRAESPRWRFLIGNPGAAATDVTVAIPDGCTLGEALELVSQAAHCNYEWNWFKFCGVAARPSCAEFRFRHVGAPVGDRRSSVTFVDREQIIDMPQR